MWQSRRLTDPTQIHNFLSRDRLWSAYALADIVEPELAAQCEWYAAEQDEQIHTLALVYRGFNPPVLLVMGEPEGLALLFGYTLRLPLVYLNAQAAHLPVVQSRYRSRKLDPMWRMVVQGASFRPDKRAYLATRLTPRYSQELARLYELGREAGEEMVAFSPSQLHAGVFYGMVLEDGRLVAAAGTHVLSPFESLAAVGNVFTDPAHRRRGYASICTSAVTAHLLQQGIRDIVLNVNQANSGAVRIYERLGYASYCSFFEGIGERK
jgi:ribosomal protein S18 acetylase RimI-like enzyme